MVIYPLLLSISNRNVALSHVLVIKCHLVIYPVLLSISKRIVALGDILVIRRQLVIYPYCNPGIKAHYKSLIKLTSPLLPGSNISNYKCSNHISY